MSDEYLWDRSGEPDAEIMRLEGLLGRLRHDRPAPDLPSAIAELRPARLRRLVPGLVIAAVLLFAAGTWIAIDFWPTNPGWQVASIEGTPRVGQAVMSTPGRLGVGQALVTDSTSRATLRVDGFGQIEVEPETRLQLLKATSEEEHLRLERGTIHAEILAPPYTFLVYTPSAYALDMGCAYTLHVDDDGSGWLRVTSGWVEFQRGFLQTLVPAGAMAETRPGIGPGAPFFDDASEKLLSALRMINFESGDSQARADALTTVLAEARKRDAFTLLNLFKRVAPEDRGRIYDRLAELVPPPAGATREGAIAGDPKAIDPWWGVLVVSPVKKGHKTPPRIEY